MRVALISNTAWLDEELTAFQQLNVGLVADGVKMVQVVPERFSGAELPGFGESVTWADSPWAALRMLRLSALSQRLEELGVDAVHALDGRVWHGALRLGQRLDVPVILSSSSRHDLPLLERLGAGSRFERAAFVASTEPLAQALRKALGPAAVIEMIPPGVHSYEEPPPPDIPLGSPAASSLPAPKAAEGIFCAAVCSSGVFDDDCQALFEALPPIIEEFPQAQFFLDGQGHDQHPLWLAARRFGLLANMSMVPRRAGRRELLLMADLMIQPQPLGRSRGLTLQAMARGLPVLACRDPWVDYLVDDQTAWLVDHADPQRWVELIRRAVSDSAGARQLGQRARQWVRPRHAVSSQVVRTLNLYRQLTGETIRFPRADQPATP